MAKVTITFEDDEESMKCSIKFDPPIEKGIEMTCAQQCGYEAMLAFNQTKKEEE